MRVDEQLNRLLEEAVAVIAGSLRTPSPQGTPVGREAARGQGAQQASRIGPLPPARWDIPKDASFGELSSPLAFQIAARTQQNPHQVAEQLAQELRKRAPAAKLEGWVDRFEATRGFVNVVFSQQGLAKILSDINRAGARYGTHQAGRGQSVLIEFVSANPTGPLNVAHGRQAGVGDVLARMLRSQGYRVTTEYYLNDEGRQIELLGQSLRARYAQLQGREAAIPEDGYQGLYLTEVARECVKRYGTRLLDQPEASTRSTFVAFGMNTLLGEIRRDFERFGLTFDHWSSQRTLRTSGRITQALEALRARGALYEADEATWFASTKFGDDKDRVVRKRSGELTYLAPDIAYHQWKFQRGYHRLINLWGPDHHGYIARVRAAVKALGLPADRLMVRIVQLVTLTRQGKPVPMSKRQGEFVTFRQVLDEVGVDATRFFFLMRTMESHLDFDLDLARAQSQENPVYYVQYAHARICGILAYGRAQLPWTTRWGQADLSRLTAQEERLLIRQLFHFPMVVASCTQALEPHGLTVYLQKLAEAFHVFYTKHRVIGDDAGLSKARLALIRATRWTLAGGLQLLGIRAPQRM